MDTQDQEQATQLQKQQSLLQQLNGQFEQQQTLLQGEIQKQTITIQTQILAQNNDNKKASKSSTTGSNTTKKRSASDSEGERPKKALKSTVMNDDCVISADSEASSVAQKVTSILPSMSIAAIQQHVESLASNGQLTPRLITRKCLPLVRKLYNHEHGWVFKDPVDPVELGIPDYFDIVQHPMDLALVETKLENGVYKDLDSFERDTKLVFENAILFNGENSDVGGMAKQLLFTFDEDLKAVMKGKAQVFVSLLCLMPEPSLNQCISI